MAEQNVTRGGEKDADDEPPDDDVAEASEESFPASDPPARTVVTGPRGGPLSGERRKPGAEVKKDQPAVSKPS